MLSEIKTSRVPAVIQKKSNFLFFIVLLFSLGTIAGCDPGRIFDDYQTIKKGEWHRDSLVQFNFKIADTAATHNLYIGLRNRGDYSNQNIWLFVTVESPTGNRVADTVEYYLAEPSGKWLGKGIGDLYDCRFSYRDNVFFPDTGNYKVSIRQGMRYDVLKGINDVGFRVEKIVSN